MIKNGSRSKNIAKNNNGKSADPNSKFSYIMYKVDFLGSLSFKPKLFLSFTNAFSLIIYKYY